MGKGRTAMTPYTIYTRHSEQKPSRDWMVDAVCRDEPPETFFPVVRKGRKAESERRRLEWQAKQICNNCPVQQNCLEYALILDIRFGIWGGFAESERPMGGVP